MLKEPCRVLTIAGKGEMGHADGDALEATFNFPTGIALSAEGSIFIADNKNHKIRRIYPDGKVKTVAGRGYRGDADGEASKAEFDCPSGVVVGYNYLFVADTDNHQIRQIIFITDSVDFIITKTLTELPRALQKLIVEYFRCEDEVRTIAGRGRGYQDGPIERATFTSPRGLAICNKSIFVVDSYNNRIRKILSKGPVETIAGSGFIGGYVDGDALLSKFDLPYGIAVSGDGGYIYIADQKNNRIRQLSNGRVKTIAGCGQGNIDGEALKSKFNGPSGIALSRDGSIFVSDTNNHTIRQIVLKGSPPYVRTVAGSSQGFNDGSIKEAKFEFPHGIAVDREGNVYVADANNNRIRKIIFEAKDENKHKKAEQGKMEIDSSRSLNKPQIDTVRRLSSNSQSYSPTSSWRNIKN